MNKTQTEIAGSVASCVVVHGLYIEEDPKFVGHAVKAIKNAYRVSFNIPDAAKGFVDGAEVSGEYVIQVGETLEFIKESGRKGLGRLFNKEQLIECWGINEKQYQVLISKGLPQISIEDEVFHFEYALDEFMKCLKSIPTPRILPSRKEENSQQDVLQSLGKKVDQLHEELVKVRVSKIEKEYYSTNEVALKTGLSPWTLSQACKSGRINAKKDVYSRKWKIPHETVLQIQNEGLPPLANS